MAGTAVACCPWKQPRDPAPWTPAQPVTWTMSNMGETVNSETEVGTRGCHMGLGAVGGRDAGAPAGASSPRSGGRASLPCGPVWLHWSPTPSRSVLRENTVPGDQLPGQGDGGPHSPASQLPSSHSAGPPLPPPEFPGRALSSTSRLPRPEDSPATPGAGVGRGLLPPSSAVSLPAPALCEHLCPEILPRGEREHTPLPLCLR